MGVTAQAATLSATSSQTSYTVGSSVRMDLTVSNVADLYAFQLDVSFDPAILSIQSADELGYFLSNGVAFSAGSIDNAAGSIRFIGDALRGNAPAVAGSTTLAALTFAAIGSGITNVVPTNIILLDSQLSDIGVSATGLSIHVLGTSPVPEPQSYEMIGTGMLAMTFLFCQRSGKRTRNDRNENDVCKHRVSADGYRLSRSRRNRT